MSLPDPPRVHHDPSPIVIVTVIGGCVCLFAAIIGLVILGWHVQGNNEVAMTGLASIGSTLAGGLAVWIGRESRREPRREDEFRKRQ